MRFRVLPALLLLIGVAPAGAGSLPVDETTYVETSLNRDGPLVVEHRPIARTPGGRRGGSSAELAGFCHDGGIIRRRDEFGQPVILRQREICDSVAPRTLAPGQVDARPTWPQEPAVRRRILRVKG